MKGSLTLKILAALFCLALVCLALLVAVNAHVLSSTSERIVEKEDAAALDGVDCILVLGCLVKGDGAPSHMLEDRLKVGCELYFSGTAEKLLILSRVSSSGSSNSSFWITLKNSLSGE